MVSGTDAHGTPVTVRADQEGVSPREVAERYHAEFLTYWRDLGISYDLYTSTMTDTHREVVQDEFGTLLDHGYLFRAESTGFFDPVSRRFLPDTYIEGECPHCHYARARGNQCENCGRLLEPEDLIRPTRGSTLTRSSSGCRPSISTSTCPNSRSRSSSGPGRTPTGGQMCTTTPSTSSRPGSNRVPSPAI